MNQRIGVIDYCLLSCSKMVALGEEFCQIFNRHFRRELLLVVAFEDCFKPQFAGRSPELGRDGHANMMSPDAKVRNGWKADIW